LKIENLLFFIEDNPPTLLVVLPGLFNNQQIFNAQFSMKPLPAGWRAEVACAALPRWQFADRPIQSRIPRLARRARPADAKGAGLAQTGAFPGKGEGGFSHHFP
jgi:hypothetical protein